MPSGLIFFTGFPGFIGKRLVEHIAKKDPKGRIYLLVQPKFAKDAKKYVDRLKGSDIELLQGDIVDMHLGLSGEEYQGLTEHVTDLFHLAARSAR